MLSFDSSSSFRNEKFFCVNVDLWGSKKFNSNEIKVFLHTTTQNLPGTQLFFVKKLILLSSTWIDLLIFELSVSLHNLLNSFLDAIIQKLKFKKKWMLLEIKVFPENRLFFFFKICHYRKMKSFITYCALLHGCLQSYLFLIHVADLVSSDHYFPTFCLSVRPSFPTF